MHGVLAVAGRRWVQRSIWSQGLFWHSTGARSEHSGGPRSSSRERRVDGFIPAMMTACLSRSRCAGFFPGSLRGNHRRTAHLNREGECAPLEWRPLGLRLQICNCPRTLSTVACGQRVVPILGLSANLIFTGHYRIVGALTAVCLCVSGWSPWELPEHICQLIRRSPL